MSIDALKWAKRQRLRGAAPQFLLWVIADAADPDGVAFAWCKTAEYWWCYLAEQTRLSRAGLFKLLKELEGVGLLSREVVIIPQDGTKPQPIIRLHLDRVLEAVPHEEDVLADVPASESTAWTQESGRTPENEPSSLPRGLVADETAPGLAPVAVHAVDSFESTPWTPEESLRENPNQKESPPTPSAPATAPQGPSKEGRLQEPIGFATCFESYLDWQAMDRRLGAIEFTKLSMADRKLATDAAPLHAAHLRRINRKPKNFHLWIRQRGFESYAPGAAPGTGQRVFLPEHGPAAEAWACATAVAFGGVPRILHTWQSQEGGKRGILAPADMPIGGTAWIVPYADWVFVEQYSARFNRWSERCSKIFQRGAYATRLWSRADHQTVRAFGRGPDGGLSEKNPMGAFVPHEWPPATGERKSSTDPPLGELSDADSRETANL